MAEQTYKYSNSSILFAKVGIVFFSLMILLGAYTAIESLIGGENSPVMFLEVVSIIVFSLGVWMSLKWLNKKKGHIIISNDGITEYCFNEGEIFIPWQEVKKVKYGRIYGGLAIVSAKNEYVHIMNGIEQFEKIEKSLFKHTDAYPKFRDKNIVLRWLEKIGIYI